MGKVTYYDLVPRSGKQSLSPESCGGRERVLLRLGCVITALRRRVSPWDGRWRLVGSLEPAGGKPLPLRERAKSAQC